MGTAEWARIAGGQEKLCNKGGNFPEKRYGYLKENQMGSKTIG